MAELTGKNIQFLQGTQAGLNSKLTSGGAIEGAFYLTNDTHRLYIGREKEDGKVYPVQVNQGVIEVADETKLPVANKENAGQFYYLTDKNVLCISSNAKWIQVNTDIHINTATFGVSAADDGSIAVQENFSMTGGLADIASTAFGFKGGAGVTIKKDGNNIVISSSGTGGVVITLAVSSEDKSAKLSQTNKVTSADGQTTTTSDDIYFVPGTQVDSVVGATTEGKKTITINAKDQKAQAIALTASAEKGFDVVLTQHDGTQATGHVDPKVTIGKTGSTTDVDFVNGKAALDVYTIEQADAKITEEIAAKLQAADAMVFKGTVGAGGTVETLPAITAASNGDTYKVIGTIEDTSNITGIPVGGTVKVGDLLVASGTEGTNGKLTDGSFILIPSGDEKETKGEFLTNGIKITDNATTPADIIGLDIAAGNQIEVTSANEGKIKTTAIRHGTITTADPTTTTDAIKYEDDKKRIEYIDSITIDNGHVTGYTKRSEAFDKTKLSSVAHVVSQKVADKSADVELHVVDNTGADVKDTINFASETLKVTASAADKKVSFDLVWGSF